MYEDERLFPVRFEAIFLYTVKFSLKGTIKFEQKDQVNV
jgi:hypothetical protein